jgi:hypothetical protein
MKVSCIPSAFSGGAGRIVWRAILTSGSYSRLIAQNRYDIQSGAAPGELSRLNAPSGRQFRQPWDIALQSFDGSGPGCRIARVAGHDGFATNFRYGPAR